jgi:hypothetical protein
MRFQSQLNPCTRFLTPEFPFGEMKWSLSKIRPLRRKQFQTIPSNLNNLIFKVVITSNLIEQPIHE